VPVSGAGPGAEAPGLAGVDPLAAFGGDFGEGARPGLGLDFGGLPAMVDAWRDVVSSDKGSTEEAIQVWRGEAANRAEVDSFSSSHVQVWCVRGFWSIWSLVQPPELPSSILRQGSASWRVETPGKLRQWYSSIPGVVG
jgi:hypothetical protein